jgi:hypothetical protein
VITALPAGGGAASVTFPIAFGSSPGETLPGDYIVQLVATILTESTFSLGPAEEA